MKTEYANQLKKGILLADVNLLNPNRINLRKELVREIRRMKEELAKQQEVLEREIDKIEDELGISDEMEENYRHIGNHPKEI